MADGAWSCGPYCWVLCFVVHVVFSLSFGVAGLSLFTRGLGCG